nr:unnamed protein product [Callosobruchus analis]
MDSEVSNTDIICRVCRSEGLVERPLFHPCICTGSIKWIHQECLMQWMRYSRKEYCELCGHRFSFTPIYSPDMPRRLPLKDLAAGLLSSIATAVKYWFHYTLVAIAWLGIVPLTACRIYRALFAGTIDAILTLPFEMLATENLASDIFQGCFVVTCTLLAFAGLVWLREQILHGGGPDWLGRGGGGQREAVGGGREGEEGDEDEEDGEVPPPAGGGAENIGLAADGDAERAGEGGEQNVVEPGNLAYHIQAIQIWGSRGLWLRLPSIYCVVKNIDCERFSPLR